VANKKPYSPKIGEDSSLGPSARLIGWRKAGVHALLGVLRAAPGSCFWSSPTGTRSGVKRRMFGGHQHRVVEQPHRDACRLLDWPSP